jgi:hypothetical protein
VQERKEFRVFGAIRAMGADFSPHDRREIGAPRLRRATRGTIAAYDPNRWNL